MNRATPRLLAAALFVAALALDVAGCGDSGAQHERPDRSGHHGGTLSVLSVADVDFLDPGRTAYVAGYQIAYATQRPLYSYRPGDGAKALPDLAAAAPQVSPNGRVVTVRLRRGIRFSPPVNRAVRADDVAYAFERAFSAPVAYPYATSYFADLIGVPAKPTARPRPISGISTPDDHTIVFRLRRATAPEFIAALAVPATAPVPRAYATRFDTGVRSTYNTHVVATGPYMVRADAQGRTVGYQPGRRIELVRNPSWDAATDDRPAHLNRIVVDTDRADSNVSAQQVLKGSHRVLGDPAPPSVLGQITSDRAGQTTTVDAGGFRYMPLNTTIRPFDDVNVRRAVQAAFDRAAAVKLRGGRGTGPLATHYLPPDMLGFAEAGGRRGPGFDFLDPAKASGDLPLARRYLRRAGYRSGRYDGGGTFLMVGPNDEPDRGVAEFARTQLEQLGFHIRLRLMAYDTMIGAWCQVPSRKVAICAGLSWLRDFPDPVTMLEAAFGSFAIQSHGNSNIAQLRVPAIDRAMRRAETLRGRARAQAWGAIDRMITAQVPGILLQWDRYTLLRSADVVGVPNAAFSGWDLSYTSLR